MKFDQINKIFDEILSYGLTPNEYFGLAMILQNRPLHEKMKRHLYVDFLIRHKWIDSSEKPTDKVRSTRIFQDLMDSEFSGKVEQYRLMWPAIRLPNGKMARGSNLELESRFKWFFSKYNYDWNTIFKATESYITYYRERGYAFMRTSGYFICKEETTKIRTSTLAEWCENAADGIIEQDYHIDV